MKLTNAQAKKLQPGCKPAERCFTNAPCKGLRTPCTRSVLRSCSSSARRWRLICAICGRTERNLESNTVRTLMTPAYSRATKCVQEHRVERNPAITHVFHQLQLAHRIRHHDIQHSAQPQFLNSEPRCHINTQAQCRASWYLCSSSTLLLLLFARLEVCESTHNCSVVRTFVAVQIGLRDIL